MIRTSTAGQRPARAEIECYHLAVHDHTILRVWVSGNTRVSLWLTSEEREQLIQELTRAQ